MKVKINEFSDYLINCQDIDYLNVENYIECEYDIEDDLVIIIDENEYDMFIQYSSNSDTNLLKLDDVFDLQ